MGVLSFSLEAGPRIMLTFFFERHRVMYVIHRWNAMDKCYRICFIYIYGRAMLRGFELLPKILTKKKTSKYTYIFPFS